MRIAAIDVGSNSIHLVVVESGVPERVKSGLAAKGHVLETAAEPLGGGQAIAIDHANGMLIGGSDNSLTLLSKLDRAEVDRLRAAKAAGQPVQLSPFLQKLLGRKDAPPPPAA